MDTINKAKCVYIDESGIKPNIIRDYGWSPKGENASFHKSVETEFLIQQTGCKLLFLPPYSPEFNPIEHT